MGCTLPFLALLLVGDALTDAVSPEMVMLEWAIPFNRSAADRYRELTLGLISSTQQEAGCLHFDIYEDEEPGSNSTRVWQYVVFVDEQAHQAHMASSAVKIWVSAISGLIRESVLTPLQMAVAGEQPVRCLKQPVKTPYVVLVEMYSSDASQFARIAQASAELLAPTRAEEGCLYYDQLLTVTLTPGPCRRFVQEVLWFVDAEAHAKHMQSAAVQTLVDALEGAGLQFSVTKPRAYTTLPAC